jgi:hypothetical protein
MGRLHKGMKELPEELAKALEPALNNLAATAKTTTDIFQKAKEASETAAHEAEAPTSATDAPIPASRCPQLLAAEADRGDVPPAPSTAPPCLPSSGPNLSRAGAS